MQENDEHIDLSLIRKHDSGKSFEVPENYYHDTEEAILRKTTDLGFTTPQGYFETLSHKIEQRIQQKQPRVIPLYNKKYWITGIAASLIAIASIVFSTTRNNANDLLADLNTVSDEEIIQYAAVVNLQDVPVEMLSTNFNVVDVHLQEDEIVEGIDEETLLNEL